MELSEFLINLREDISARINDEDGTVYPEIAFLEVALDHASAAGIAPHGADICSFEYKKGNSKRKISAYAISEDFDSLDLFICLYGDNSEVTNIPEKDLHAAANSCLGVLTDCVNGAINFDPASPLYTFAPILRDSYESLDDIRIFVVTDGKTKSKSFKPNNMGGKLVRLEVLDIERMYRQQLSGKASDEIEIDLSEKPLPCVRTQGELNEYEYILTTVPGDLIFNTYMKYGPRLLEANVRSFLDIRPKSANKEIQNTLRFRPEKFMAFNNGMVLIAEKVIFSSGAISGIKGLQIVNGGQTAATIYFSKRKYPDIDLTKVNIAAKILIMQSENADRVHSLINDISRFANTQSKVKTSDHSSNNPFHIALERVANTLYCPDGVGRWFYERSTGSYTTMLALDGNTDARRRKLKNERPAKRKLTKLVVAKLSMGWLGRPDIMSLGNEKCFTKFMDFLEEEGKDGEFNNPDAAFFKKVVGQHLILKYANKTTRMIFPQAQSQIASYTYALISEKLGSKINFEWIWQRQEISPNLSMQIDKWAEEVGKFITDSSRGRMISEWAKKEELLGLFNEHEFSDVSISGIPEA